MLVFALAFPHWFRLALCWNLVGFKSCRVYRIMLSCDILSMLLEMIIWRWLPRFRSLVLRWARSLLILAPRLGLARIRSLNQRLLVVSWYLSRRRRMLLLHALHLGMQGRFGLRHTFLMFLAGWGWGSRCWSCTSRVALVQCGLLEFAAVFFVCLGGSAFCGLVMLGLCSCCFLEEMLVPLVQVALNFALVVRRQSVVHQKLRVLFAALTLSSHEQLRLLGLFVAESLTAATPARRKRLIQRVRIVRGGLLLSLFNFGGDWLTNRAVVLSWLVAWMWLITWVSRWVMFKHISISTILITIRSI